jgi:TDG/mug DNA glycosylase family protein
MGRRSLPDHLCVRPRLLLVGLNPGAYSAQVGHYYARRANRFWPLLHRSGLVPLPLTCEDDSRLPEFGIAITDLVKRASGGIDALAPSEFRRGAARIRRLVASLSPGVVAFNGLAGYRTAFDPRATPGEQAEPLEGCPTFVLPSTSPRVATWTLDELLQGWIELRMRVDEVATSRTAPSR